MAKKIPLTQGKFTVVEDTDYEWLNQWKWRFDSCGYAARTDRSTGKTITIRMHRLINSTPKGLFTDHVNGNRLDNRRNNLRTATHLENSINRTKSTNIKYKSKSRFKGVTRVKPTHRWRARGTSSGKLMHIGWFDSEIEAAEAYNEFAKKHFGEYAQLNDITK